MDNVYRHKALERLEIAYIAKEKGLYNALASNIYFAIFHYIQSILEKPLKDKWRHIGIASHFTKYCIDNNIYGKEFLKNFSRNYEKSYDLRKQADYNNIRFSDDDIRLLLDIFEYFAEVIKNDTGSGYTAGYNR